MVRGRARKYKMDRRGIRGLNKRMRRESSTSRGRARLCSEGIQVRGGSHSVTSRDTAEGQPQSSEFGEGKL